MTHHTFSSGLVQVTVPADEAITLTLNMSGDSQETIELTELAADLISLSLTREGAVVPDATSSEAGQVEMGTLECGDGIAFSVDGQTLPADQALTHLGAGVVAAIRAAVEQDAS